MKKRRLRLYKNGEPRFRSRGLSNQSRGVRLVIGMDRQRRIPKFEIEDVDGPEQDATDDLDTVLAEARKRGINQAAQILAGRDMLSGSAFAKFIGVSREAVRAKRQQHEVLGLRGAKRGLRFPKWQVTSDGSLLPGLPRPMSCSHFIFRDVPMDAVVDRSEN